jgi:hypothetical protein
MGMYDLGFVRTLFVSTITCCSKGERLFAFANKKVGFVCETPIGGEFVGDFATDRLEKLVNRAIGKKTQDAMRRIDYLTIFVLKV